MAQFSVKIMRLTGSVLGENQQDQLFDLPRVAVGQLLGQADHLAILFGHQTSEGAPIIAQQVGEGRNADRLGDAFVVELQAAGPKPAPVGLISGAQGAGGWCRAWVRTYIGAGSGRPRKRCSERSRSAG